MTETMTAALPSAHLQDYHYPKVYESFVHHTTDHEMVVLHDDGLYRHLRFKAPGTMMWHFDLITWPGHLSIAGDIGDGFTFTREADMLTWFDHGQAAGEINPGYWAQKMPHHIKHKSFSEDIFRQRVREDVADYREELLPAERASFTAALERDVLGESAEYEHTAREALDDFRFTAESSGREFEFTDTWEWSFSDYDHHFLLACNAILWGAQTYRASKTEPKEQR